MPVIWQSLIIYYYECITGDPSLSIDKHASCMIKRSIGYNPTIHVPIKNMYSGNNWFLANMRWRSKNKITPFWLLQTPLLFKCPSAPGCLCYCLVRQINYSHMLHVTGCDPPPPHLIPQTNKICRTDTDCNNISNASFLKVFVIILFFVGEEGKCISAHFTKYTILVK